MDDDAPQRFVGRDCTLTIEAPTPHVICVELTGRDVGELGHAPFELLERQLKQASPVELFIDAREGRGATLDVSGQWAAWLREHRARLRRVYMLTGSRFINLSARFVRDFAELGETMHITADPTAFDDALTESIGRTRKLLTAS